MSEETETEIKCAFMHSPFGKWKVIQLFHTPLGGHEDWAIKVSGENSNTYFKYECSIGVAMAYFREVVDDELGDGFQLYAEA